MCLKYPGSHEANFTYNEEQQTKIQLYSTYLQQQLTYTLSYQNVETIKQRPKKIRHKHRIISVQATGWNEYIIYVTLNSGL